MSEIPIRRYLARFFWVFLATWAALTAVSWFTPFNFGSLASLLEFLGGAVAAGYLFVKDHDRAATKQEINRLIAYSYGIGFLCALTVIAGFAVVGISRFGMGLISQEVSKLLDIFPIAAWIGISIISFALPLIPLYFGYGPLTRSMHKLRK